MGNHRSLSRFSPHGACPRRRLGDRVREGDGGITISSLRAGTGGGSLPGRGGQSGPGGGPSVPGSLPAPAIRPRRTVAPVRWAVPPIAGFRALVVGTARVCAPLAAAVLVPGGPIAPVIFGGGQPGGRLSGAAPLCARPGPRTGSPGFDGACPWRSSNMTVLSCSSFSVAYCCTAPTLR